jgi:hypothetical protein
LSTSDDIRLNVWVELVEAVICSNAKGKKKKRGDGNVDGIGVGSNDSATRFDVSVRSEMVLPRTTTVKELLKKLKARLKMRGNPKCAFFVMRDVKGEGDHGREVKLDRDLRPSRMGPYCMSPWRRAAGPAPTTKRSTELTTTTTMMIVEMTMMMTMMRFK